MKKIMLLLTLLTGLVLVGSAQSIFKPLPKPGVKYDGKAKINIIDTLTPGGNYTGLRFTGPTVLYAVNTTTFQQSALFTGVGIDYESDYWDPTASKFYTNWAIGAQFMEGGQFAPSTISAVTAAALTFSFQKIGTFEAPFKITLGFIYNFSTKSAMLGVGPGIPLNN